MKVFSRVLGILVLIAAVIGGVWFYRQRTVTAQATSVSSGTFTQLVTAQRGNLSAALTVVGSLESVQQETLSFQKLSGSTRLLKLNVTTGAKVQAGETLASVDAGPYSQALDQAKSNLQSAEQALTDLQTPPTDLEIAQADQAVKKAEQDLQQARQDLADLKSPDLTDLKNALVNAQDALQMALLQQTLTQNGGAAKNERDLQYAVDWHNRKLNEYQQLVATGKASKEQADAIATEQDALGEARANLATTQAQRQLALQTAAASVVSARAALADAQKALADAQKGGDALAQAKAELAVKIAEVALVKSKSDRATFSEGPDATKLAAARADRDKKQLAVADTEAALAATELKAPFDGTVLQVNLNQGDLVANNVKVLTLANLGQLQVLASVDETTVRSVQKGQKAQVSFDALPGQILNGLVGDVPLQGILQGGVTVYEVPVSLQGADKLPLLVGMTANVKIATGEAQNVVLVPTMALTKANGMYQVLVADPVNPTAQPQAVPVQVGLSDGTYTQITAGLNEGDQVIVEMSSGTNNNFIRGGMMFFEGGGGGPPGQGGQQQRNGSTGRGG